MYISLHSYGQKILYPWSHRGDKIPDWQDLDTVGRMMQETVMDASGGRYFFRVGTSPVTNYYSNGGSDDWIRGRLGIKWVFLYELPDRAGGRNGFLLPAREIIPTGHAVFNGIRRAALEVQRTLVWNPNRLWTHERRMAVGRTNKAFKMWFRSSTCHNSSVGLQKALSHIQNDPQWQKFIQIN